MRGDPDPPKPPSPYGGVKNISVRGLGGMPDGLFCPSKSKISVGPYLPLISLGLS